MFIGKGRKGHPRQQQAASPARPLNPTLAEVRELEEVKAAMQQYPAAMAMLEGDDPFGHKGECTTGTTVGRVRASSVVVLLRHC